MKKFFNPSVVDERKNGGEKRGNGGKQGGKKQKRMKKLTISNKLNAMKSN